MEQIKDNMQKYANYKTQMGRLKKALSYQFYLEAILLNTRLWKTGLNPFCVIAANGIQSPEHSLRWMPSGRKLPNWPRSTKIQFENIFLWN